MYVCCVHPPYRNVSVEMEREWRMKVEKIMRERSVFVLDISFVFYVCVYV